MRKGGDAEIGDGSDRPSTQTWRRDACLSTLSADELRQAQAGLSSPRITMRVLYFAVRSLSPARSDLILGHLQAAGALLQAGGDSQRAVQFRATAPDPAPASGAGGEVAHLCEVGRLVPVDGLELDGGNADVTRQGPPRGRGYAERCPSPRQQRGGHLQGIFQRAEDPVDFGLGDCRGWLQAQGLRRVEREGGENLVLEQAADH